MRSIEQGVGSGLHHVNIHSAGPVIPINFPVKHPLKFPVKLVKFSFKLLARFFFPSKYAVDFLTRGYGFSKILLILKANAVHENAFVTPNL